MKVAVSEFKAKCTRMFRDVEELRETIEVTRRGKVIAIIRPPETGKTDPAEFLGCLQGTVSYTPDWDDPLGEDDWDTCK